ncbi:MAG: hypothetical protein N2A99_04620 [Carnobacterium alterfunditum]
MLNPFSLIKSEQQSELKELKEIADILNVSFPINNQLGNNLHINEKFLRDISEKIRNQWIDKCTRNSMYTYKSPDKNIEIYNINNNKIEFGYERCLSPDTIEKNINSFQNTNWSQKNLIFSSAMSAMTCVLISLNRIFYKRKIKGSFIGGYFETYNLVQAFNTSGTEIIPIQHKDLSKYDLNDFDFHIIEPTIYNFSLETVDIENIVENIQSGEDKKIKFLVIDSTLLGSTFNINRILEQIDKDCSQNIIPIIVRSLVKTDQFGFEFANAGLLSIYINSSTKKYLKHLDVFLGSLRSTMGLGIELKSLDLLSFSTFTNSFNHAEKLLRNTDVLAKSLRGNRGILGDIIHPILHSNLNSQASPFVFIQLKTKDEKDCIDLLDFLVSEIKKIGFDLRVSNSFGFRDLNLEYIKTLESQPKYYLKISPGQYKGLIFYHIINLINSHEEIIG